MKRRATHHTLRVLIFRKYNPSNNYCLPSQGLAALTAIGILRATPAIAAIASDRHIYSALHSLKTFFVLPKIEKGYINYKLSGSSPNSRKRAANLSALSLSVSVLCCATSSGNSTNAPD